MKESLLSPSTRALLQAAKSDAPGMAARAKIWGAVSTTAGIAAAAAKGGAAAGSAVAAASSGKLLVAGALLGSAMTVGIALAVVRVVSGGPTSSGARLEVPVAAETRAIAGKNRNPESVAEAEYALPERSPSDIREEPPPIPLRFSTLGSLHGGLLFAEVDPGSVAVTSASLPIVLARGSTGAASSRTSGVHTGIEDPLSRESALILEARGALRRGDPEAALASLGAARRVGSHMLEPEELSVRARTLRALGRDSEAAEAEGLLKTRYPDQALAR